MQLYYLLAFLISSNFLAHPGAAQYQDERPQPSQSGYYPLPPQASINNGAYGGGYQQQQVPSTPDMIDNEVTEPPTIRCTDRGVQFSINTRNPFRGNIYVQGQFGLTECRREFYNNDAPHAAIEVQLNECGMIRERRPHGMSYSLVIITNFHPRFVTKVDRAYKILCSYQHTDRPVGVDLEVGSVPTVPLESDALLVPDCEYTMRLGDVNGPPAPGTVKVGDLIFHRWECQNSPVYGMLVKNCRVFDGGNENATLIDERGCPTHTGVIQSPPVYSDGLNLAYAPIFAFHFPDRTQMNFRCQIQSCNKMDNECVGLTPPNCPQNYGPSQNSVNNNYGVGSAQVLPPPQQEAYGQSYGLPTSAAIYPAGAGQQPGIQQAPPTYIGAGFSPTWPPNAMPLGSVLRGNPSQVLQGIGRPWPRRRMESREGQTLEHKILMATQQLRRHENGSWPPGVVVLDPKRRPKMAAARRFFHPIAPEEDEMRLRQRRAEEKTQDVVATSTVLNDGLQGLEWTVENGKQQVRPRSLTSSASSNSGGGFVFPNSQQRPSKMANTYCLDRSTLVAFIAALGLLGALVCTMVCYLLWDFLFSRFKCRRSLISDRGWNKRAAKSRALFSGSGAKGWANDGYSPHSNNNNRLPAVSIMPLGASNQHQTMTTAASTEQRQQGPGQVLAGILNAGLVSAVPGTTTKTGQQQHHQRVPPPVPPKPLQ